MKTWCLMLWDKFCHRYLANPFLSRTVIGMAIILVLWLTFAPGWDRFILGVAIIAATYYTLDKLVLEHMIEKIKGETKLSREEILKLIKKDIEK